MKLENKTTTVTGNLGIAKKATIDAANLGKLWTMLQSPYKNPIGSIVREITSNCFDAHRDAKVNDAVIIEFTKDESGIKIAFKDKGTGMSPEVIDTIYNSYLASTKEKTNDFLGAFGIGSKSPLSYVDAFYIDTRVDGKEWNYVMSKGEDAPEIILLVEKDTTERNGTTISFYLHKYQVENRAITYRSNGYQYNRVDNAPGEDFETFIKEIHKQLFYFENVYVVIDQTVELYYKTYSGGYLYPYLKDLIKEINDSTIYQHNLFNIRTDCTNPYKDIHVCIGPVTYPIDWNQIPVDKSKYPFNVGLKFNIGDLPVIQTREDLNYGKKETINAIVSKLDEVLNYFKNAQKEKFEKDCDNLLDYFILDKESQRSSFSHYFTDNIFINVVSFKFFPTYTGIKEFGVNFQPHIFKDFVESSLTAAVSDLYSITNSGAKSAKVSGKNYIIGRALDNMLFQGKNYKSNLYVVNDSSEVSVAVNKFLVHPSGLNKNYPYIFKKNKMTLERYKKIIPNYVKKDKWRDYIKLAQKVTKELWDTLFIDYNSVEITKEYRDAIKKTAVKKAVDDTLLLHKHGNYTTDKIYKTPEQIEKENNKKYVYIQRTHNYNLASFLRQVNSDSLIANKTTSFDFGIFLAKNQHDKVTVITNSYSRLFYSNKLKKNFQYVFVDIADSKVKHLKKLKNTISFDKFKKNMKIVKKLANSFYFANKLDQLSKDRDIKEYLAYVKLINSDLFNTFTSLSKEIEEAYMLEIGSGNVHFRNEIIEIAKEKNLLRDKEIDNIFEQLQDYQDSFISINSQNINSLVNIVYLAKCKNKKIAKKYFLKIDRNSLVELYHSKNIEDKVLALYAFDINKVDRSTVLPNNIEKNKVLTF